MLAPLPIRLVLFDIDGTLIHTGGAGVRAFGKAFETAVGIRDGTRKLQFAGRTDTSLARELFQQHRIAVDPLGLRDFFDHYVFWLDHFLHQLSGGPCAGVMQFIDALKRLPQPPRLGLLTGNIRLGAEIKLRHYSLWEPFEWGAFGDDHEDRNVLAAIAHERGRSLSGAPINGHEVLIIGDTWRDIACARAIGARVIAVATGDTPASVLRDHAPDALVDDLRSVRVDDWFAPRKS